jgi:SAM-dependent methyltransferase
MGIRSLELQMLARTMAHAGLGFKGATMLELGDQMFTKELSGKDFFEERGVKHTSVDWNGRHGALPHDLSEPLELGEFDIVTNFGTAEHVSNQRTLFRNIHNATKPGGIIVHQAPIWAVGINKRHGIPKYGFQIRYSEKFFVQLGKDNGYELVENRTNGAHLYVGYRMPAEKKEFRWRH